MTALLAPLATSIYSLIGAYLLDLCNCRGYLLSELTQAIGKMQDVNADLQDLALTGLPNRRHFESQFSAC